ncbi:MAG: hypothetical protein Ta2F_08350 [Termitinemataceae bacterium]|nr:MAG: hypothetical protein Ta2F_08350 [Termitinemataceae bacterium]
MKKTILFVIIFIAVSVLFSCNTTSPTVKKNSLPQEEQDGNQNTEQAQEQKKEKEQERKQEHETGVAQIVQTAEELTKKIETFIDVDLPDPPYNFDQVTDLIIEIEPEQTAEISVKTETQDKTETEPKPEISQNMEMEAAAEIEKPAVVQTPPPAAPAFARPSAAKSKGTSKPVETPKTSTVERIPPQLPAKNPPTETHGEPKTKISRTVDAFIGQYVEVPYRGTGWVFLGEQNGKAGLAFDSRRGDDDGQSFIFRAEKAGTYLLKFYKQDFLRDYYINDFVQINVSDNETFEQNARRSFGMPSEVERVTANPRWPSVQSGNVIDIEQPTDVAESEPKTITTQAQTPSTESHSMNDTSGASSEELLSKARTAYEAAKYQEAIEALDIFRRQYPAASDEAWWLYGKCFESNSNARDIRSSLDAYTHLVQEYPQSKYYNDAEKRIAYLNKFYFNIR